MRHDRIELVFEDPDELHTLTAWIKDLVSCATTQLPRSAKRYLSTILLEQVFEKPEAFDKLDPRLALDVLPAFHLSGIRVEKQVPEFATMLHRRGLHGTSTQPLASLLRQGLAEKDPRQFEAALQAAIAWLNRASSKGKDAAVPVPATLLGALGQALVPRDDEKLVLVLNAVNDYLQHDASNSADIAIEVLPALRERVDDAIQDKRHDRELRKVVAKIRSSIAPLVDQLEDPTQAATIRAIFESLSALEPTPETNSE